MCSQGSPSKGTKSEVATSTLPSHGPMSGRRCYVTPAFSGVPIKGHKIRKGYLTPAFSGGHMRAQVLCSPSVLGVPIKGDKNGQSRANGKMP